MKQKTIPFNRPFIAGKELLHMAEAVITNRHISGNGPFTKQCEAWLEERLGCRRVLLTHSCTAALEMVGMLCDLKPGDEVIMPAFTFVSTANSFVLRGAVPVFVDIRPDTLNIDEQLISQAITPRTRGIVPVHYAGVPCAMDEIMGIAAEHDLWVAEDAAHALLSTHKGKYLGTIADFGCLSFHETKNIISGEGGALLVNSNRFIERAEILREKGTDRSKFFRGEIDKYSWVDIGSSYLPSDLVGAFLYAQLQHAEEITLGRRRIASRYNDLLRPLHESGFLTLPLLDNPVTGNGHIYHVIAKSFQERTQLISFLSSQGISAVFHYVPLHSSPAGKKFARTCGSMEVTENLSQRVLRLPMYFGISEDEICAVAEALSEFYKRSS